ncbi:histidine kinase [Streptomyces sp. NPDC047315]|uniref:sensor histidine kinase n=1 Tax=Streptomyces sp. NPDC047315 TaxID=3155142 RepID=UPI0033CE0315
MTETTRSPEYRLAVGVLQGLRQDLFHDAFAYRPLAPLRTDGPLMRKLPERIRERAQWGLHGLIVAVAAVMCLSGLTFVGGDYVRLMSQALVPAAITAMLLVRPVGAFWCSLLAAPVLSSLESWGLWPWTPAAFAAHLLIMFVVTLRTRPRTAVWMWVLTAFTGLLSDIFMARYYDSVNPQMLLFSALVLLGATVINVRRAAEQEVRAAEQEVQAERTSTAVERDKRTLLEERTTIARELHDVVAHHMSVVAIQAEAAPYRVENPPEELEKAFATIRENAVAALTELRRILGVVRAEDYEAPDAPQPVLADLENLLSNVRDAGLDVTKTVTGAVRTLPPGVELSAYRIVQEALSNALRHAPGSSAKVEVSYVLGGLGLRVVNTAPSGLVKPSPGAGHGITGMRERVSMLNGELTAGETEDGGYEVTAFVPVPAAEGSYPNDKETTA